MVGVVVGLVALGCCVVALDLVESRAEGCFVLVFGLQLVEWWSSQHTAGRRVPAIAFAIILS